MKRRTLQKRGIEIEEEMIWLEEIQMEEEEQEKKKEEEGEEVQIRSQQLYKC